MTRRRILVIDDEVGSTRLLKANLEMTDLYEVRVENRPENAVSVALQFHPHVVLLDIVMPQMSGIEVARAIRREPELSSVLIALLTAADASLLPPEADPAITDLPRIAKPAFMEHILQFLDEHFSLPRTTGPPGPGAAGRTPGGYNEHSQETYTSSR